MSYYTLQTIDSKQRMLFFICFSSVMRAFFTDVIIHSYFRIVIQCDDHLSKEIGNFNQNFLHNYSHFLIYAPLIVHPWKSSIFQSCSLLPCALQKFRVVIVATVALTSNANSLLNHLRCFILSYCLM